MRSRRCRRVTREPTTHATRWRSPCDRPSAYHRQARRARRRPRDRVCGDEQIHRAGAVVLVDLIQARDRDVLTRPLRARAPSSRRFGSPTRCVPCRRRPASQCLPKLLRRPPRNWTRSSFPASSGTRQEIRNGRLHESVNSHPSETLLTSVCTGQWMCGEMGLLHGISATSARKPDRAEANPPARSRLTGLPTSPLHVRSVARASSTPDG